MSSFPPAGDPKRRVVGLSTVELAPPAFQASPSQQPVGTWIVRGAELHSVAPSQKNPGGQTLGQIQAAGMLPPANIDVRAAIGPSRSPQPKPPASHKKSMDSPRLKKQPPPTRKQSLPSNSLLDGDPPVPDHHHSPPSSASPEISQRTVAVHSHPRSTFGQHRSPRYPSDPHHHFPNQPASPSNGLPTSPPPLSPRPPSTAHRGNSPGFPVDAASTVRAYTPRDIVCEKARAACAGSRSAAPGSFAGVVQMYPGALDAGADSAPSRPRGAGVIPLLPLALLQAEEEASYDVAVAALVAAGVKPVQSPSPSHDPAQRASTATPSREAPLVHPPEQRRSSLSTAHSPRITPRGSFARKPAQSPRTHAPHQPTALDSLVVSPLNKPQSARGPSEYHYPTAATSTTPTSAGSTPQAVRRRSSVPDASPHAYQAAAAASAAGLFAGRKASRPGDQVTAFQTPETAAKPKDDASSENSRSSSRCSSGKAAPPPAQPQPAAAAAEASPPDEQDWRAFSIPKSPPGAVGDEAEVESVSSDNAHLNNTAPISRLAQIVRGGKEATPPASPTQKVFRRYSRDALAVPFAHQQQQPPLSTSVVRRAHCPSLLRSPRNSSAAAEQTQQQQQQQQQKQFLSHASDAPAPARQPSISPPPSSGIAPFCSDGLQSPFSASQSPTEGNLKPCRFPEASSSLLASPTAARPRVSVTTPADAPASSRKPRRRESVNPLFVGGSRRRSSVARADSLSSRRSKSVDSSRVGSPLSARPRKDSRRTSLTINFLRAKTWKANKRYGFSRQTLPQTKTIPRPLWHETEALGPVQDLVAYAKANDPTAATDTWVSHTRCRAQGASHAVIFACGSYTDPAIPNVPLAETDAKALKTVLTDCRFTVDLLCDSQEEPFLLPTRENLLRILDLALNGVKKVEAVGDRDERDGDTDRTPPLFLFIIARGIADGHPAYLQGLPRFAFTRDASWNNDSKHSGVIPLSPLMHKRDAFGRKPLIICDLWSLPGGIQSARGQAGNGFIGGFDAVAGELDAQYPPSQEGGLLTHYVIKGLQGKALRSSTLTPCALNAYVSSRLLKQNVEVRTEAGNLTGGNKVLLDRDAVAGLKKQHRAWLAVTRWGKCRWDVFGELPLDAAPRVAAAQNSNRHSLFKTHLLQECYRLLYHSKHKPAEEHFESIQLATVSQEDVVVLHMNSPILNSAESNRDWLQAIREWCGADQIVSVELNRCAQSVSVRVGALTAVALIAKAQKLGRPVLGRTVRAACARAVFHFTGCVRDCQKTMKMIRGNVFALSKSPILCSPQGKLRFHHIDVIERAHEQSHRMATDVQRVWRGSFTRQRHAVLRDLWAEESGAQDLLRKGEADGWEFILETERRDVQQGMMRLQMEEYRNVEDWELEERLIVWKKYVASWAKAATATDEHPLSAYAAWISANDHLLKDRRYPHTTRPAIQAWEQLNSMLLHAISGQLSIMRSYANQNIFKIESMSKNEVWARYNVANEEYMARLNMQRDADSVALFSGIPTALFRVPYDYRPVKPVVQATDIRWGDMRNCEERERTKREEVLIEERAAQAVIFSDSEWLRAEQVRVLKVRQSVLAQSHAMDEEYRQTLEQQVIEEDRSRAEKDHFVETRMRLIRQQQDRSDSVAQGAVRGSIDTHGSIDPDFLPPQVADELHKLTNRTTDTRPARRRDSHGSTKRPSSVHGR